MFRDPRLCFRDITRAIERIQSYTDGTHDNCSNQVIYDAVVYNLQVIGSAIDHLPPAYGAAARKSGWDRICNLGVVPISEYYAFEPAITTGIVGQLPLLRQALQKVQAKEKRNAERMQDLKIGTTVKLIISSSVQENGSLSCRLPNTDMRVTVQELTANVVEGEILTITPTNLLYRGNHAFISGTFGGFQADAATLGIEPLMLYNRAMWDPRDVSWGDREPQDKWIRPVKALGLRMKYVMQDLDEFSDALDRATGCIEAGEYPRACDALRKILDADIRCLSAHCCLGYLIYEHFPLVAKKHYEVGYRIGELSLGKDFDGVLLWDDTENRPFLRCMHGYGLCLWILREFEQAEQVFKRILYFNPTDDQGIRYLLDDVCDRKNWKDLREGNSRK